MTFAYDRQRLAAVDTQSGAVVYQSSKLLDEGSMSLYVYESEGFSVEFRVLPVIEPYQYRWKGEKRPGRFTARMYVIETLLRGSFNKAFGSQTGTATRDDSYRKFRDTLVEALVVCVKGEKALMREDANFEIPALPDVEV